DKRSQEGEEEDGRALGFRSALARLARIVALSVDGWHTRSHWPEVRRQLAAMVNRVTDARLQIGVGGQREDAAEVDRLHQLVSCGLLQRIERVRETVRVPPH